MKGKVTDKKHLLAMKNRCYAENCGFPKIGNYKVSRMQFLKVTEQYTFTKSRSHYYLLESCLNNTKNSCFRNLPNNFIDNEKMKIVDRAKNELEFTIQLIIAVLIGGFIDDRLSDWRRKKAEQS